jgi:hypothetical protein
MRQITAFMSHRLAHGHVRSVLTFGKNLLAQLCLLLKALKLARLGFAQRNRAVLWA